MTKDVSIALPRAKAETVKALIAVIDAEKRKHEPPRMITVFDLVPGRIPRPPR